MEAQLGLVGGTMGLLTGFSILSAVEITYFLVRFMICSTNGNCKYFSVSIKMIL